MDEYIALVGHSGFIGTELLKYFKDIANKKIFKVKSIDDFEQLPKNCSLIFAAGKFIGEDNELIESNFLYLKKILDKYLEKNGKRFIYLSSGAVYGLKKLKKSKETDLTNPIDFYGFVKKMSENYIIFRSKFEDFNYQILRLPNVYGDNQNKGVIYEFRKKLKFNKPFIINGDGTDYRDYLHINDLIHAIELIHEIKPKKGIYNISSDLSLNVLELSNLISGSKNYPKIFSRSYNNIPMLSLNYEKAINEFGYKPKINKLYFNED